MSSNTGGTSTLDNQMEAPLPKNLSLDKQSTIRSQLIKGTSFANQLLSLLRNQTDYDNVYAEEVAMNILASFTDTLSMLSPLDSGEAPAGGIHVGSPSSGDRMSQGSVASRKRRSARNDKRGSYKRRTSDARIKVSSSVEDGYAWRKYGQKEILNSKQPRCYYRCTHKYDRGCKATKQVQKLEEDPNSYQITYYGRHTCENLPSKPINMFQDFGSCGDNVLNFGSNHFCNKIDEQHPCWSNSTSVVSLVTELEEESKAQSEASESENVNSAQSTLWDELTPSGSLDHETAPMNGFDHEDLFYLNSYQGVDVDFSLIRHANFGSDLQFDEMVFA